MKTLGIGVGIGVAVDVGIELQASIPMPIPIPIPRAGGCRPYFRNRTFRVPMSLGMPVSLTQRETTDFLNYSSPLEDRGIRGGRPGAEHGRRKQKVFHHEGKHDMKSCVIGCSRGGISNRKQIVKPGSHDIT